MKIKASLGILAAVALSSRLFAAQSSVDSLISSNLFEPHSVAVDVASTVFLSDGANNRIVKYVPSTTTLTVLAGLAGQSGSNNGTGVVARFSAPQGLVLARGGLVVADLNNHTIRFVTLLGAVTNLAGSPGQLGNVNASGPAARFRYPIGLAADAAGNIFVADSLNNSIRKIDLNNAVTTVASGFYQPAGVTVGDNGDLWVADTRNHQIKRIDTNGVITVIAGTYRVSGLADDLFAANALFNSPRALLWLGISGLLITDSGNHTVRRLYFNPDIGGYSVETFAGTPGVAGLVNGNALAAKFNSPVGLARDIQNGGFVVADRANNQIRRINSNPPLPPVTNPKIGIVELIKDTFGDFVTRLTPVTSSVFNNDVVIAILAEEGTATFFTQGATPASIFEDSIPSPGPLTGLSPPAYRDGRPASEIPVSMTGPAPDLTIKAIGTSDGRQSSSIIQARFQFKAANPNINGDNAASFHLENVSTGAEMWYTIDGSEPTNNLAANPSVVGPRFSGDNISFALGTNNVTFKVRAFKANYKPSDTISKVFSPANFVANNLSFGFESGEASSEFVAAAGQRFYVPVTLTLLPGQKMYSLQFNVVATNLTGTAVDGSQVGFQSLLEKPIPATTPILYTNIAPAMFVYTDTNPIPSIPVLTNLLVTNIANNLLGVGWLERFGKANLYDTAVQDLITYSRAHDTRFLSANGKVVLGGYSFIIPTGSVDGQTYQIKLDRASATADGVSANIYIRIPTNGAPAGGTINGTKTITVGTRKYLVGDVTPFRWFNAGDFGDTNLLNNDVLQLFQSAVYGLNNPPAGSDFFDAMDSSDGSSNQLFDGNDTSIDSIKFGDGILAVDDIFVTFRRSLDPSLKWYARYWSNNIRQSVEVPNQFPAGAAGAAAGAKNSLTPSGPSSVSFSADDAQAGPNQTIQIPIRARILGSRPIRVLMLNLSVAPIDGSPALTQAVQFTPAAGLGAPTYTASTGPANYAATWLNNAVTGVSGTNLIGTLTITIPAGASPAAAYRINFDHISASPNGLALFPQQVEAGLITLSDRSASSWGDGIPDQWRLKNFASLSNLLSAASADADGDGVTNWAEYRAGSDPNNKLSKLQLLSSPWQTGAGSGVRLRWPTGLNRHYVIECSPSITGAPWTVVSANVVGDGGMAEFLQTNALPAVRFYRVRVTD